MEEKHKQIVATLKEAVTAVLVKMGVREELIQKVWTSIEINVPAEWFPNGYSDEILQEAIDVLHHPQFSMEGLYTNPVIMRMMATWRGLAGEDWGVRQERPMQSRIDVDKIRGLDTDSYEFWQDGDVLMDMPEAWFPTYEERSTMGTPYLPTRIAEWLEGASNGNGDWSRRYSGARWVERSSFGYELEVYYVRPHEASSRSRNSLEATAFRFKMRLISGNLLVGNGDELRVTTSDGRLVLQIYRRLVDDQGHVTWKLTHQIKPERLVDDGTCPTSLSAAVNTINRLSKDVVYLDDLDRPKSWSTKCNLGDFLLQNALDVRVKFDHATQTPKAMVAIVKDLWLTLDHVDVPDLQPIHSIRDHDERAEFLQRWGLSRLSQAT